jgi:hypothetical protein
VGMKSTLPMYWYSRNFLRRTIEHVHHYQRGRVPITGLGL